MVVCRAYYRSGATVAAPGFPKEGGGQANSFCGWWWDLVFTNHHTTLQKIKDFNDLVGFFFYKNEEIERKMVWETGCGKHGS